MPEMDAPRALLFQPLVKGNVALGTRLEPMKFVRLNSEHAQSDGTSVNRRLPVLEDSRVGTDGTGQRSRFLVLTKRSTAPRDESHAHLPVLVPID